MEDSTIKALIIGTSITVTLVIVTLVFVSFNQMKEIYLLTQNTNTSIHSRLNEHIVAYNGERLNGMELLNMLKKYEDNPDSSVIIVYPKRAQVQSLADTRGLRESVCLKQIIENKERVNGQLFKYEKQYRVTVTQSGTVYTVRFS